MKSAAFLSVFSVTFGIVLSVALPEFNADLPGPTATFANYSRFLGDDVPQGTRIIPRLENQPVIDGGKRVNITYGPFSVKNTGMFERAFWPAQLPCTDCYNTLYYQDGKEANIDTGAWLHHVDWVTSPNGRPIWASGNERPTLRLNSKYKYGIDLGTEFFVTMELMSESKKPEIQVKMVTTFEYVPKSTPGYKASYLRWNDIGNRIPLTGVVKYPSYNWTSPFNGKLLYAMGHMHDGGVDTRLFINDKLVCTSIMHYGLRPGYITDPSQTIQKGGRNRGSNDQGGMSLMHISDNGLCENFGDIKVGDRMRIECNYDSIKFGLFKHDGKNEEIMGIMRVFMGPESDFQEHLDECEEWGLQQKKGARPGECDQLQGFKAKSG